MDKPSVSAGQGVLAALLASVAGWRFTIMRREKRPLCSEEIASLRKEMGALREDSDTRMGSLEREVREMNKNLSLSHSERIEVKGDIEDIKNSLATTSGLIRKLLAYRAEHGGN